MIRIVNWKNSVFSLFSLNSIIVHLLLLYNSFDLFILKYSWKKWTKTKIINFYDSSFVMKLAVTDCLTEWNFPVSVQCFSFLNFFLYCITGFFLNFFIFSHAYLVHLFIFFFCFPFVISNEMNNLFFSLSNPIL